MNAEPRNCAPRAARSGALFAFALADQDFAVPAESVREVARLDRIAPVPMAAPMIAGIARHGGRLVPVVDLRPAFALSSRGRAANLGVLVERDGELHALLAESVEGPWTDPESGAERSAIAAPARFRPCCAGIALRGERPLVILDLASLLAHGAGDAAGSEPEHEGRSQEANEHVLNTEDWERVR